MRRLLVFLLKAALSAALLYLSLRRVNLDSVGTRLSGLDLRWIAFCLLLLCMQMPLLGLRWRDIAMTCSAMLPLPMAVRFSFIGQFFSQVLPSTVGGDAVRIWLMARGGAGWRAAIYSVLIDRVVGVSALAVLVVACLPWTVNLIHDPMARGTLALIGFGALGAALVFLTLGTQHMRLMDRWWLTRHLAAASRLTWQLGKSFAFVRVALLSFAIHFTTAAVAWGAAKAASISIDYLHILILFLPVLLIATIPISIAGWGVRESAMVLAFSFAGLAEGDGLIVSIIYGAATLAVGAIGGCVWVASGYRWTSLKSVEASKLPHNPSP